MRFFEIRLLIMGFCTMNRDSNIGLKDLISVQDLDTEVKLDIISSWAPDATKDSLLDLLINCDGDLATVGDLLGIALKGSSGSPGSNNSSINASGLKSFHQTTLKRYVKRKDVGENEVENRPDNFFKKFKNDPIKGKTLHLYDPIEISDCLPCTFHLNAFPTMLAQNLLKYLLEESQTWSRNKFYLFERAVVSPHSTCFYSEDEDTVKSKSYMYNGKIMTDIRPFNDDMAKARDIVETIVNEEIAKRGLKKYQYKGPWKSSTALCNKYDGPSESVGSHSDQITHIGPHCVIASISLGVTREFRLKSKLDKNAPGISVHVPHNSLLIMHAGCQEEFKHSIMPAKSIEVHPVAGKARINITYRMYLDSLAPSKLPRCSCDKSMILRSRTKPYSLDKASKAPQTEDKSANVQGEPASDYFWSCGGVYYDGKG